MVFHKREHSARRNRTRVWSAPSDGLSGNRFVCDSDGRLRAHLRAIYLTTVGASSPGGGPFLPDEPRPLDAIHGCPGPRRRAERRRTTVEAVRRHVAVADDSGGGPRRGRRSPPGTLRTVRSVRLRQADPHVGAGVAENGTRDRVGGDPSALDEGDAVADPPMNDTPREAFFRRQDRRSRTLDSSPDHGCATTPSALGPVAATTSGCAGRVLDPPSVTPTCVRVQDWTNLTLHRRRSATPCGRPPPRRAGVAGTASRAHGRARRSWRTGPPRRRTTVSTSTTRPRHPWRVPTDDFG